MRVKLMDQAKNWGRKFKKLQKYRAILSKNNNKQTKIKNNLLSIQKLKFNNKQVYKILLNRGQISKDSNYFEKDRQDNLINQAVTQEKHIHTMVIKDILSIKMIKTLIEQEDGGFMRTNSKFSSLNKADLNNVNSSANSFKIYKNPKKESPRLNKYASESVELKYQNKDSIKTLDFQNLLIDRKFSMENPNQAKTFKVKSVKHQQTIQNNTLMLPKFKNFGKTINAIPEEEEEKTRRRNSLGKSRNMIFAQQKQYLMKSAENMPQTQALGNQTNEDEKKVKSIYMKSAIIKRMMMNQEKKLDSFACVDPIQSLNKMGTSYLQIMKEPISYKIIQSRLDKWRVAKIEENESKLETYSKNENLSKIEQLDTSARNTNKELYQGKPNQKFDKELRLVKIIEFAACRQIESQSQRAEKHQAIIITFKQIINNKTSIPLKLKRFQELYDEI
ncbi:UNKNOWN [Stylonychia lemnae]|uniref:Uncharacterized protein n=1 Tax=Stylonychia lemnae TaxID=5949 RepID=A0A077ZX17_STYLE|nr:UNKNOWN [Stylonychia lemnae]|eukprot:CDW74461.1 UNKNOWN [Stylonychia lemnae]